MAAAQGLYQFKKMNSKKSFEKRVSFEIKIIVLAFFQQNVPELKPCHWKAAFREKL